MLTTKGGAKGESWGRIRWDEGTQLGDTQGGGWRGRGPSTGPGRTRKGVSLLAAARGHVTEAFLSSPSGIHHTFILQRIDLGNLMG